MDDQPLEPSSPRGQVTSHLRYDLEGLATPILRRAGESATGSEAGPAGRGDTLCGPGGGAADPGRRGTGTI